MSESDPRYPLNQYPAYSLWESDPLKDRDHRARLECLLDLRWAVDELKPWAGSIIGGTLWILALLLIKIPDGNEFLWGFPIFLFAMGVPGTCYYTHKYRVLKARLKGMTVKCWNPNKCGKQIRAEYKFCPFCGYRLPSLPPSPRMYQEP